MQRIPDEEPLANLVESSPAGTVQVERPSGVSQEKPTVIDGLTGALQRSGYVQVVKPALDRTVGVVLSIATLPVVLFLGLLVMATMGWPVIYLQRRVGLNGRPFTMFKFRTMLPDRRKAQSPYEGPERRRVHKSPRDPRVTSFGRFLRKWSLDEIPQLWNIALGQMSLVGPRPELVEIVETKYEVWQHHRHVVKPGLTGPWQISDQRHDLMYNATHIDLEYLHAISPTTDIKILLLTVPAILGRRRAI